MRLHPSRLLFAAWAFCACATASAQPPGCRILAAELSSPSESLAFEDPEFFASAESGCPDGASERACLALREIAAAFGPALALSSATLPAGSDLLERHGFASLSLRYSCRGREFSLRRSLPGEALRSPSLSGLDRRLPAPPPEWPAFPAPKD